MEASSNDPRRLSIAEVRAALAARRLRAADLAAAYFAAIERDDPGIHAYLTLSRERALAQAERLDRLAAAGDPLPPLAGAPLGIKDVIALRGVRATCGSRMLENYVAPYDATVIERLDAAGALFLGKLNCDEFAMGSSNENSAFGPVRNPHDRERVPGGSSGGSAAAVAAQTALATLGSDTGGSIRQPAAFCGVLGLMPTYGRVSRYGLTAFGSSLDRIGPLARSVRDAAAILQVIAGQDPRDATTSARPVPDYLAELDAAPPSNASRPLHGLRIGIVAESWREGLDPEVEAAVRQGIARLESLGCLPVEVSLPRLDAAIAIYYILATAEASSNLARYDGVRYGFRDAQAATLSEMYRRTRDRGFGPEVKRRILLGTYVLSAGYYDAYYRKAQQARTLLARDFAAALANCDALVLPTSPTPAFRLGEKTGDPLAMYLADIYTVPASLAGLPGISLPCGAAHGLPVGLQLVGPRFAEARLLRLAQALEAAPFNPPQS